MNKDETMNKLASDPEFAKQYNKPQKEDEEKNVNTLDADNKEETTPKAKKPLSKEGVKITKKLEEMTGIKLLDDEDIHNNDGVVDNSKTKKDTDDSQTKPKDSDDKKGEKGSEPKSHLQNVKDVDLGENDANKPLVFKCPNDLKLTIKKDSGEYVIDEDCCTALTLIIKNTGEIATTFSGSHSPNLVKILEKSLKRYLRDLKRTLKKEYKISDDNFTLSKEPLEEEKRWK